jgi:uncharacterized protein (TIGR00725 family)
MNIGVIGSGGDDSSGAYEQFAHGLGESLVDSGFRVVCGGLGGVMAAVCRGAHASDHYEEGATVGILPGSQAGAANAHVDIAIPTGMGHLRNAVVAQSEAVVAIGGGAGTLSEIALAWVHGRPIFAADLGGWSDELAGRALDDRRAHDDWLARIHPVSTPEEAVASIESWRNAGADG